MFIITKTASAIGIIPILFFAIAAGPDGKPAQPATQPPATQNAPAFKSQIFDDLDQFHRIVILCDGSGSMLNKLDTLKYQLSNVVESLSAEQSFNIIFFEDKTFNPIAKELLPATAGNKKKAAAFLEELALTGTTDPVPGLEEAFREKPDVIYLLSDGDFADNENVVKTINQGNKEKKTKVYTVALLNNADVDPDFIAFFKKLAADCDGKFKRLDVTELERPPFKSLMFDDLDKYHRITFLADGGGSMINKIASLKDQMNKAAASLSAEQSFNFIFFPGANGDSFGKELVAATRESKKKASTFLEGVTPLGTYDPLRALPEVFREKPDVIYLITDGDFPDNDAMLKKFRELNKDKKVKVYTIAFRSSSDTDTAFIDLLKTIASESGGKYKYVKEDDL